MSINTLLRGVSAGAIALVCWSSMAEAQQSLPTIDIGSRTAGKPQRAPISGGASTGGSAGRRLTTVAVAVCRASTASWDSTPAG